MVTALFQITLMLHRPLKKVLLCCDSNHTKKRMRKVGRGVPIFRAWCIRKYRNKSTFEGLEAIIPNIKELNLPCSQSRTRCDLVERGKSLDKTEKSSTNK